MRIANTILVLLIAASCFLATAAKGDDQVYRWVDENGVVHFGDMPPGQSESEQITINASKPSSTPSSSPAGPVNPDASAEPQPSIAQQLREERAEKRAETKEKDKMIAEACEQRRTIVSQLEPSTRVMVREEDGTVTRLDDSVRLETLNEAKTYIANNCNN